MGKQDKIKARQRVNQPYPHLEEVTNIKKLRQHVNSGNIKHVPRPAGELRLFDYTTAVEKRHKWDGPTSLCRGLLVDNKQMVVGRSLPKFFSHKEKKSAAIPSFRWTDTWETQEKMDGTMISVSNYHGERIVTTRRSFDDWRIKSAEKLLGTIMPEQGETFVFEYVSPSNLIVVPYAEDDLVLLAVVDNWTGADKPDRRLEIEQEHGLRPLRRWDTFETVEQLLKSDAGDGTLEGYVLVVYRKGKPSIRLKVKMDSWYDALKARNES